MRDGDGSVSNWQSAGSRLQAALYTLAKVGWFWSVAIVLFFGGSLYLTSMCLIKCSDARGILSYSKLIEHEFGTTVAKLNDVSMVLATFGMIASYMVGVCCCFGVAMSFTPRRLGEIGRRGEAGCGRGSGWFL